MSSLLDLDDILIGTTNQGSSILEPMKPGGLEGRAGGLPPPLMPNSLFNVDPTGNVVLSINVLQVSSVRI